MKLRILFVTLMVTLMANAVFGAGQIYWQEGVTANWTEDEGYGDPYYWWIEDSVNPPDDRAWAYPKGNREIQIYGAGTDITVDSDVHFTTWFSNRSRIFGGATVRIADGGNLEGMGWLRVGENSKPGASYVIQTGGSMLFENGATPTYKDPAGLTLGDVGAETSHGYYIMSGGTLSFLHPELNTGRQAGNIRIGDRAGQGTLQVIGTDPYIKMRALDIGGRNDKDETRAATGNLVYTLEEGGVSAVNVDFVDVHAYIASVSRLVVEIADGVELTDPTADILLVKNLGTTLVHGLFDTCNGGYAGEGAVVDIGDGIDRILTYKYNPVTGTVYNGVGGNANWNDIALVPEPATLALLSLGMFIIRRKK